MDKLRELEEKAQEAEKVLRDVLLQQFPIGMEVSVLLNAKQVNPSAAVVVRTGYSLGHVRVRLLNAKRRSTRDVHYTRIV